MSPRPAAPAPLPPPPHLVPPPGDRRPGTRLVLSPVLLATGLYALAHAAWLAFQWGGPGRRVLIADAFNLPYFVAAMLAALRTARHPALDAGTRRAWRWLAASYAPLWLANVAWTWQHLAPASAPAALGRLGQVLVILSYGPLLVGLMRVPGAPRTRDDRRRIALDLAVTVLGAGLVLWHVVIHPAATAPSAGLLRGVMELAAPVLDIAVVAAIGAVLLGRVEPGTRQALRLVAAGQLLSMGAGVVGALLRERGVAIEAGHWVDAVWLCSEALLVVAADVQWQAAGARDDAAPAPAERPAEPDGVSRLPYFGLALGYALLLAVARPWWGEALGAVVFGAVALSALVVLRQAAAVRENRRLVAERLAQEAYYRGLIEHASDLVLVAGPDGRLRYASPAARRAFCHGAPGADGAPVADRTWGAGDAAAETVYDHVHAGDVPRVAAALGDAAGGARTTVQLRARDALGRERVLEAAVGPLPGPEPAVVLNVRDATERAEAAAALGESQRALETLLRNLPGMAYRCRNTPDWPMEFVSHGCLDLTGYAEAELTAAGGAPSAVSFAGLVLEEDRDRLWDEVQRAVAERRAFQVHYRIRTADGRVRDLWEQGRAVYEADGAVAALEGYIMDVTEQKRLETRLEHQAFHDSLTGLANRALFRDRVAQALARARRDGSRPTVLFLDLDDFKAVNDSLGHAEGDRLLVEAAARLLNATRGCDTVSRLGGDEFAVLLDGAQEEDAAVVAGRIMRALARPVALSGGDVVVRASVGIAAAAPGEGADELLRNADLAMYRAKARGKGTCEVFAAEMYQAMHDRVALEADLRLALERGGELWVAYQPIVDLATGRVAGVEALARWAHPRRGAVPPSRFIDVAEQSGLIHPLGRLVLAEACRQAAAWRRAAPDGAGEAAGLYVAVNISGRQLQDAGFVADVADALAASGLAPDALLLEITEGVVMHDTEANLARLADLKALGVRLAIDDFGTGYSSLSYLQRFPVDVLKIDKSFVDGVHGGGSDEALTRTIVALGRALALGTVAEGVETPAQRDALRALGCTLGQGYLFAAPLPPAGVAALLGLPAAGVSGEGAARAA